MQTPVHTIVKNLFHRDSLEEVDEEQLQDYIRLFPYSSIGHLLLARKRKEQGDDYKHASATASLYVSNPLWLHCFLGTEVSPAGMTAAVADKTDLPEASVPEPLPLETGETETETVVVNERDEEVTETEPATVFVNERDAEVTESSSDTIESALLEKSSTPAISDETPNAIIPKQEGGMQEAVPPQEELVSASTVVETEVVFEPYHTIDYFASQGIKLKAEDLAKDKFGRQLKSFTDWLRTMKRIAPVAAENAHPTEATDPAVLKKAEESVEISDVDTEAMAEVWIKQGKPARAIAIYHKLSLLNPSKSHYFAAKIEQLNA